MHAVDRMLELVKAVGVQPVRDMRLYTGPKERGFVERRLGGKRYAVLAPTSRWPAKRWPAERFAAVGEHLLTMNLDAVVLVGGQSEREQCRPLIELAAREPRIIELIGVTTVGELMAVIQSSALVIANDSAALHMAVGFDRPSVGLFGPTRVELVGPYTGHEPRCPGVVIQHVRAGEQLDHKAEHVGREQMERISAAEVIAATEAISLR
jgi:ADP-heptose:LPS heptosyltransferase